MEPNELKIKSNMLDSDWLLIYRHDELVGRINKCNFNSDKEASDFAKETVKRWNTHSELLEALNAMRNFMIQMDFTDHPTFKKIESAIAKATK